MNRSWILVAVVGASCLVRCTPIPGICDDPGSCKDTDGGADADGGPGDAPIDGYVPPGCDPLAEPKDAPKCVVDKFGVFVDATGGAETNLGTKASPVKTIATALAMRGGKPRVYVCEGSYAEHVKLTSGVAIYGGFACGTWTYSGTKAKVAPSDAGYALEVNGAMGTVADVEFVAQPGTDASRSSVAVAVTNSPQLSLRRVKVEAGAGFKGDDGADGAPGVATPASLDGIVATASAGGAAKGCTCSTGGTSKGAKGGDPTGAEPDGANGEIVQVPSTSSGAGQTRSDCEGGGPAAKAGSDAPAVGNASAPSLGTLDATGWRPGDGSGGPNGVPGQGGGGGGSYVKGAPIVNGGGGGGACGGCGGGGGGGGKGGGASIAIISVQSTVTVQASQLVTANAGAGGTGKTGIAGGAGGGKGGVPVGSFACTGGNGGSGGAGGAGSGGAGGISVGVLSKGPKPTLDTTTTVTTGDKGTPGAGGAGNNGPDGRKAPSLELQ